MVLVGISLVFLAICFFVYKLLNFFLNKKDAEQDTLFFHGPWSNNDDSERVSAPWPPPLPASVDGHGARTNNDEGGDRPLWQQCQQPPTIVHVAAADVGMAFGDVQLMQADMEWVLAKCSCWHRQ
jgi:hypothetical protein